MVNWERTKRSQLDADSLTAVLGENGMAGLRGKASGADTGAGWDGAAAMQRALADRVPQIHHSDQGMQYACGNYTDLLREHGVQISMAVGKPEDNGYAERLMRTIKEEEVDLSEYADFYDAYRRIGRFLEDVYTCKRIHSALGYLTPAEFEATWLTQQSQPVLK
ncbi:MAG: hypothetical protein CUN53_03710 [Phototrophicales bacterium]|nr:MAG: hypothetical protein CUN53_03710 [Phototrophicales bacterium]